MKFAEFQKIARMNRECVVTEKIDGTNAQVFIANKMDIVGDLSGEFAGYDSLKVAENETHIMFAGSRTRWITPGKDKDNYGFAGWVQANSEELFKLGEGHHYGEWWGNGCQRNYGLKEKRFSLFNTARWTEETKPACCSLVPVLYQGVFDNARINAIVTELSTLGSKAVPGFMNPEGVVVYHVASRTLYKITCKDDEQPKSLVKEN